MITLSKTVRKRRNQLGLTQSDLSRLSGISVATIQNLEAGIANPSFESLTALLSALELELHVSSIPVKWDFLAICGLPIFQVEDFSEPPDPLKMAKELCKAIEPSILNENSRVRDAIQALLIAVKIHYPKVFRQYFNDKKFDAILKRAFDGRVIKLEKIALAKLGRYL